MSAEAWPGGQSIGPVFVAACCLPTRGASRGRLESTRMTSVGGVLTQPQPQAIGWLTPCCHLRCPALLHRSTASRLSLVLPWSKLSSRPCHGERDTVATLTMPLQFPGRVRCDQPPCAWIECLAATRSWRLFHGQAGLLLRRHGRRLGRGARCFWALEQPDAGFSKKRDERPTFISAGTRTWTAIPAWAG